MGNRRDVLAQLAVVLGEISEIKTVVRSYLEADFDVTQYAQADLPLVVIPEPAEETEDECTSQHSMMSLTLRLMVYFLDWAIDPDATKYESLVKKIRDKIGANFTLNEEATECRIISISTMLGSMPVYKFLIDFETRYYLDEKNV